jgi:CHAT domain-containing protein
MEFSIFRYSARRGKLFCNLAQKNDADVKEEFAAILQLFDEDRKKIKEDAERNTFFDIEQSVYDAAIDYAYTTAKDSELAFNYAENSRARSLLDLVQANSEKLLQPLSVAEIQRQIPSEVQLVYYAVLPDKILTWYISDTKFTAVETAVEENELVNEITNYRKSLFKNSSEENTQTSAKKLYELLIEPVESSLEKGKILCFVADKQLFQLPLASLVSPQTNKYLIEDYALFSTPSATILINETDVARRKASAENEELEHRQSGVYAKRIP